ncbi:histidine kinase [Rhodoferax sp. 4810]|nr:histidine kinase [Rhodoferax jenense]
MPPLTTSTTRLDAIAQARRIVMHEGATLAAPWVAPWVVQSWQRCLGMGLRAQQAATFQQISAAQLQRTLQANHQLIQAAKPVLQHLGRAIVNTRYFVILTNADGVVVDSGGAIDHADPRAHLITRVGTDLSEASMGTTAIGTALNGLQSVWLHRGEHFFDSTSVYSCAGAPLFGPDGACVGMLDVTGVDAIERPELKHLVTQSASKIENALLLSKPHALTLRLNWPGNSMGSDADGLVCLDADGVITGANTVARQMVPGLALPGQTAVQVSEVFGVPASLLFDAARPGRTSFELPLWTGLRLQALALLGSQDSAMLSLRSPTATTVPLRDVQATLIRKAVADAHGNVTQAAQVLGISRATVYRELSRKD